MAFTAGFSVNVGDPTKASDVDVLAANDDYLKNAIDTFIANDANNRVLTGTGSGTANAETNLTFDGSTLTVTGTVSATTFSGNVTGGTISGTTGTFSGDVAVDSSVLKVDTANNRVGINVASPVAALNVYGNNYSPASGGQAVDGLVFRGGTAGDGTYTNGLSFSYGAGSAAIAGVQNGADSDTMGMAFFTHSSGTGSAAAEETMRLHSNGDISFYEDTGTTAKFFWDASAEALGIGTLSPGTNASGTFNGLHIEGTATNGELTTLLLRNPDTTFDTAAKVSIEMKPSNSNRRGAKITAFKEGTYIDITQADSGLQLSTVANDVYVDALRITSAGNVGIGTTSPTATLTVAPTAHGAGVPAVWLHSADNAADHDGTVISCVNNGSDAEVLHVRTNNTTYANGTSLMLVRGDGNVGISTDSPTHTLDVNGSVQIERNGASPLLRFTDTSSSSRWIGIPDGSSRFAIYGTDGSTEEFVLSGGNVGIGTTSPHGPLTVKPATNENLTISSLGSGDLRLSALNDAQSATVQLSIQADPLYIRGTGGVIKSAFLGNGNVGIGTSSPVQKLELSGGTSDVAMLFNSEDTAWHNIGIKKDGSQLRFIEYANDGTTESANIMVLEANGDYVGIGTTSPRYNLAVKGNNSTAVGIAVDNDSGSSTLDISALGSTYNGHGAAAGEIWFYSPDNINIGGATGNTNDIKFLGNGSERARITSAGSVGIGQSSPSGLLHVEGGGIYHIGSSLKYIASSSVQSISSTNNAGAELTTDAYLWINRSSAPCVFLNRTTTTGQIAVFYSDLTPVGSISVTASTTAYNTSSDYRLKENLAPITGAVDRVNALQPRRFNFIAEPDKVVDGFVAHEVSNIVPEAITGEKDAVDADGNPEYQGIDQSKLVPLLTAAIQELTARIEALEAA